MSQAQEGSSPAKRGKLETAGIGCLGFVAIFIVIAIIGALLDDGKGDGASANPAEVTRSAGSTSVTSKAEQEKVVEPVSQATSLSGVGVAVGDPVKNWSITVEKVTKTPTVKSKTALGIYVVLNVALENTGTKKKSIDGDNFKITDRRGREFKWYQGGTISYGKGELESNIIPGLTGRGALVFDVPPDARGLVLSGIGDIRIRLGDVADFSLDS